MGRIVIENSVRNIGWAVSRKIVVERAVGEILWGGVDDTAVGSVVCKMG